MAPLLNIALRDVKTTDNAYPEGMDTDVIARERRIAYGVLAMCVAIWFILAAIVTFLGGRDEGVVDSEKAPGVALKDVSSSEATTQASTQMLMMHGAQTGHMEKGKGRAV